MHIPKYRIEFFSLPGKGATPVKQIVVVDRYSDVQRTVWKYRQPSFNWCYAFKLYNNITGAFLNNLTDKNNTMSDLLKCFPETITIHAVWTSNTVLIDEKRLEIEPSQRLHNHSAEFAWGYSGSGPAQLALAMLLKYVDRDNALKYYQTFKDVVIACLPNSTIFMTIQLREKMQRVLHLVDGTGQPELFKL